MCIGKRAGKEKHKLLPGETTVKWQEQMTSEMSSAGTPKETGTDFKSADETEAVMPVFLVWGLAAAAGIQMSSEAAPVPPECWLASCAVIEMVCRSL